MLGQLSPKKSCMKSGPLRWLFNEYHKSSSWSDLSVATRRQRENIFKRILETNGDAHFEDIGRKHIVEGRESWLQSSGQISANDKWRPAGFAVFAA
jgi:hypothetical protein